MNRRVAWVIGILVGGFVLVMMFFVLIAAVAMGAAGKGRRVGRGGDRVGIVEVLGEIKESKKTLEALDELAEDSHVKAIVLRVDSPGGAVGPSQEIYDAVRRISEKKKVVASMGGMAASGGFYIASGATKVYANAGTLTGSIGVIFQLPNFSGLMKWAGVSVNTITSGKMKDSGSPFREMTPEERGYFETVLHDVHEQFIEAVAQGRHLKVEEVRPYADGRVFTGRQAKEWKLVDEVGGIDDAVAEAGKLGGIHGKPEVEYRKEEKPFLRELLSDESRSLVGEVVGQVGGFGLQYRLAPGGF